MPSRQYRRSEAALLVTSALLLLPLAAAFHGLAVPPATLVGGQKVALSPAMHGPLWPRIRTHRQCSAQTLKMVEEGVDGDVTLKRALASLAGAVFVGGTLYAVSSGAMSSESILATAKAQTAFLQGAGLQGMAAYALADIMLIAACQPGSFFLELYAGFVYGPLVGGTLIIAAKLVAAALCFLLGGVFSDFFAGWLSPIMRKNEAFAQIKDRAASSGFLLTVGLRLSPLPSYVCSYGPAVLKVVQARAHTRAKTRTRTRTRTHTRTHTHSGTLHGLHGSDGGVYRTNGDQQRLHRCRPRRANRSAGGLCGGRRCGGSGQVFPAAFRRFGAILVRIGVAALARPGP